MSTYKWFDLASSRFAAIETEMRSAAIRQSRRSDDAQIAEAQKRAQIDGEMSDLVVQIIG
jgi:hypothetical protein